MTIIAKGSSDLGRSKGSFGNSRTNSIFGVQIGSSSQKGSETVNIAEIT